MIVVRNMETGKIIEDEFGSYEDEVLNAEWLPPLPELQLALQEAPRTLLQAVGFDADSFLNTVYLSQE